MDPSLAMTWLFVPGDRPDRFGKALASGADIVIADLEDAVEASHKAQARDAVRAALHEGTPLAVRVNADHEGEADLAMLADSPVPVAVLVAKAEHPSQLAAVAASTSAPLVPLIESAVGLLAGFSLATVPGVVRLAFGAVDFSIDIGIIADDDTLAYPRSQLVLASRISHLAGPIDTPSLELLDRMEIARAANAGRRFGMGGKLCIHPAQVKVVRDAYRPTTSEVAHARAVLGAVKGEGASAHDGRMVDRPVLERARRVLKDAEA